MHTKQRNHKHGVLQTPLQGLQQWLDLFFIQSTTYHIPHAQPAHVCLYMPSVCLQHNLHRLASVRTLC
jgi:hypothetical protein